VNRAVDAPPPAAAERFFEEEGSDSAARHRRLVSIPGLRGSKGLGMRIILARAAQAREGTPQANARRAIAGDAENVA
jgi:hypothetical protein